jgi:hypothetical protein
MLCILDQARKNIRGKNCLAFYIFCNIYNRYAWIEAKLIKNGNTKTGRNFPVKDKSNFDNAEDYLSQWKWNKNKKGYLHRTPNGVSKWYHREVWEFYNGLIPKGFQIDHINRDTSDNRIDNLRLATPRLNNLNKNNKGYYYHIGINKWSVMIGGKYGGTFDTEGEAKRQSQKMRKQFIKEEIKKCQT